MFAPTEGGAFSRPSDAAGPSGSLGEQSQARDRAAAPMRMLSVQLMDTYMLINKRFYEERERRQEKRRKREEEERSREYTFREGETLHNRYVVEAVLGKGSFGQVVRARDTRRDNAAVAIKIIKSNSAFQAQARAEIELLRKINAQDPADEESGIVRMHDVFVHRGSQCLVRARPRPPHSPSSKTHPPSPSAARRPQVLELLHHTLYDVLRYTEFKGVSLTLTRK